MIGSLDAARALLTQYGQQLREARTGADLSMAEVAAITGVQAPYLSRIEHGRYCPTETEAERIGQFVADLIPGGDVWEMTGPGVAHARMSDPVSSDVAVKSVAADGTLADKILACARDFRRDGVPVPFDDTDLTEALNEHHPQPSGRPFQRNVVAKARLCLMTHKVLQQVWTFGRPPETVKVRVPLPDSPLQQLPGVHERIRDGRARSTIHFVYSGDADTRQEEGPQ